MTFSSAENRPQVPYRGRFAPSPSGPLHFGSLIAALGSYLDARAHHGTWLVRIEDIDPPRQKPHADTQILTALEKFGLLWDESVRYQSSRIEAFEQAIQQLINKQQAYYCHCTRKRIQSLGGRYDGHCRHLSLSHCQSAVRFYHSECVSGFHDLRLGWISLQTPWDQDDFIIRRRDGLIAYQLAVVMDDIDQRINHVVRGQDLLETTGWQLALYRHWQQPAPNYLHLPVALDAHGQKLSKQNHAPALNSDHPQPELCQALAFLNTEVPTGLHDAPVEEILQWAISHWQRKNLPPSSR